ncbi:MAG TPA: glycoside hydrolase family 2 TIM barrel-domain containing protein [Bryobacteraceae bacterium]|nr:glycoside hydrolase family 2 TIM barrel-domain containing protein [Bryobacteraceae bacterium]
MNTGRRKFLTLAAAAPAAAIGGSTAEGVAAASARIALNGAWRFRLDPRNEGERANWHTADAAGAGWRDVQVPHTWQVEPENTEYRGVAWYRRAFDAPDAWTGCAVRIEFEAVFHSATVWINGVEAGRHTGKGYTAFTVDATPHLRPDKRNTVAVRVNNAFEDGMLPRRNSSDWAHDGGIYRPVWLLVNRDVFIESMAVDADLDLTTRDAALEVALVVRNSGRTAWEGAAAFRVTDEEGGNEELSVAPVPLRLAAGERKRLALPPATVRQPRLWHFDQPALYRLSATLSNGEQSESTFGVRKIEVRDGAFFLNGERVRLMGVERMAGSNPEFGMAEPAAWIEHDHADMKELNCVYMRVHWPQDRRLLDWCDRHGIFIQTEVPTWGSDTFAGMTGEPSAAILNNGLEQLREMIGRDRNHPCLFSWGVSNEIDGQNPPAAAFTLRLYEEAKKLDPRRLVSYASNSLQKTPEKDVAGRMDYVMWNEYYGSWYGGTPEDMARNLEEIHRAFPSKPMVISEYGYCACTPERPEGDTQRMAVLERHDRVFRAHESVAGLIFFNYNDYRTHVGDRGTGALRQRVHGVVDLYGVKKASWEALRRESSPVEAVELSGSRAALQVAVRTRAAVPSYTLRGYKLRGIAFGAGQIPVERVEAPLPALAPGATGRATLAFAQPDITHIRVELLRPTGFSVCTSEFVS